MLESEPFAVSIRDYKWASSAAAPFPARGPYPRGSRCNRQPTELGGLGKLI